MASRRLVTAACVAVLLCQILGAWQLSAQDAAKTADTKKEAADAKTIGALIGQLGDASFDVRETAAKKLTAIGEPALDHLDKAIREIKDPELRNNADTLV